MITITLQPVDIKEWPKRYVTFSTDGTNDEEDTIVYQWYRDNVLMTGETAKTLNVLVTPYGGTFKCLLTTTLSSEYTNDADIIEPDCNIDVYDMSWIDSNGAVALAMVGTYDNVLRSDAQIANTASDGDVDYLHSDADVISSFQTVVLNNATVAKANDLVLRDTDMLAMSKTDNTSGGSVKATIASISSEYPSSTALVTFAGIAGDAYQLSATSAFSYEGFGSVLRSSPKAFSNAENGSYYATTSEVFGYLSSGSSDQTTSELFYSQILDASGVDIFASTNWGKGTVNVTFTADTTHLPLT